MFTEKEIIHFADSYEIFKRGQSYYREGRIISFKYNLLKVEAKVKGHSGNYKVEVDLTRKNIKAKCSCPYEGKVCKHQVAVLLKFIAEWNKDYSTEYSEEDNKNSLDKIVKTNSNKRVKLNLSQLNFAELERFNSPENMLQAFQLLENNNITIEKQQSDQIILNVSENKVVFGYEHYNRSLFKHCNCRGYQISYYNSYCVHICAAILYLLKQNNPQEIPSEYQLALKEKLEQKEYNELLQKISNLPEKDSSLFSFLPSSPKACFFFFEIAPKNGKASFSVYKALYLKNGLGKPSLATRMLVQSNRDSFSAKKRKVFDLFCSVLGRDYYLGEKLEIIELGKDLDLLLLDAARELYLEEAECFPNLIILPEKAEVNISFEDKDNSSYIHFNLKYEEDNYDLKESILIGKNNLWALLSTKDKINEPKKDTIEKSEVKDSAKKLILVELSVRNPQALLQLYKYSGQKFFNPKMIDNCLTKLHSICAVRIPGRTQEIRAVPKARIYLQEMNDNLNLELRFVYAEFEVGLQEKDKSIYQNEQLITIIRDFSAEKNYLNILLQNALWQGELIIPALDALDWLDEVAPQLTAQGFDIFGEEKLLHFKLSRKEPKLKIEVSSGIDWFDLKTEVEVGEERIALDNFANAISNQQKYIQLNDGSKVRIPKKWLEQLSGTLGFMKREKNNFKATPCQLSIIESLLDLADQSKTDVSFEQLKKRFEEFKGIKKKELPLNFNGELRGYQKHGYNWLYFLQEFSFGGCLADEMGLGKTIQVLALLQKEKEKGVKILSLIVVPTSLLFNWAKEAEKFTPQLRVYLHHGTGRTKEKEEIESRADLIVTSYGTLRRDKEFFQQFYFNYLILDESQQIKNPIADISKSVRELRSSYRLVMTGTPVENNTLDLWSQFAFLNPGFLGSMEHFRQTFSKGIEKEKDQQKIKSLKNLINPFLLVRKKDAVAKELPEKQITVVYCDMEEKQRVLYDSWKRKIQQEILTAIEEEGFLKSRMKILQGLMKLRQICNHPKLVDASFLGESGKFNLLAQQIEEVMEEGHKILIFSSFVKMLHLFEKYFEDRGVKYAYLDGSTRKRQEEVEKFQNDPALKVFLISLKAGGLGLNLTAADYVFIVDPWWNPAAEMQAIDRTHRIGQDKKVFVYKAITKDSIEEKILELQESKKELVSNLITVEEGLFKRLGAKDIQKLFE